jgi:hypothetical protein
MKCVIGYSSDRIFRNCHIVPWHFNLIKVATWLTGIAEELIFTSGHRSKLIYSKDSGIHGTDPLRAFDLRSYIYKSPKNIENRINSVWTYDYERPQYNVAKYHDTGLGVHFHIQVHDNTKARWEG